MMKGKKTYLLKCRFLICVLISIAFFAAGLYAQVELVGHWTFDSNYFDSSPDPAHADLIGGTTYITNEAMVGVGSLYVAPENNAGLFVDKPGPPIGIPDKLKVTNKFTLSAWAKFEEYQPGSGTRFAFIMNHFNRDVGYGMYVQIKSGSTLYMVGLSGEAIKYQPPDSIPRGTWVFITYTYDNTRGGEALIGYKNGEYDPNYVRPTTKDHIISNTEPLYIGRGGEVGYAWGGLLDDVSIWDGTLSDDDVRALYRLNIHPQVAQNASYFSVLKKIHDRGFGATNFGNNSCSYIDGLSGNTGNIEEVGQPGSGIYSIVMDSDADTGMLMTTNAPMAVNNLIASFPGDVVLSWDDCLVETSYTLFRSTNIGETNVVSGIPCNQTQFTDTSYFSGKNNYYWIKAYNINGESPYSSVAFIIDFPPGEVTDISAYYSGNEMIINWDKVNNVASYTLFRSTNFGETNKVAGIPYNQTQYIDTNCSQGTNYYWIKACNRFGESGFSDLCIAIAAQPDFPSHVSGVFIGNAIVLSWENVLSETSYTLFRSLINDYETAIAISGTAADDTEYDDPGYTEGQVNYYWVKAYNTLGESEYSPVAVVTTHEMNAPWPMFKQNAQHTGSKNANVQGVVISFTEKWSFPNGMSDSSPAIGSDGTIYIGGDKLYAIKDGVEKWAFSTIGKVVSSPAIGSDGTIYVGCNDGRLYAVKNGAEKWSFLAGDDIKSSPAVGADDTIYVGCDNGKLYAIKNGVEKWSLSISTTVVSSPAIGSDGTIYIGSSSSNVYAITNGAKKWSCAAGNFMASVQSSPVIGSDGTIYVGSDNGLCAITNGAKKWSFPTGGIVNSSPAIGLDGTIYLGSEDGKLYAIKDGIEKWSIDLSIGNSTPVVGSDGTVYIGSDDTRLYAIKDDNIKSFFTTSAPVSSSPAIGPDGTIYASSRDGYLYAIQGIVISQSKQTLEKVVVGPNPYKPYDNNPETGTRSDGITFANLSDRATIRIYTMAGMLIATLEEKEDGDGHYIWDVTNDDGKPIASGMYVAHISNPDGDERIERIMIIK